MDLVPDDRPAASHLDDHPCISRFRLDLRPHQLMGCHWCGGVWINRCPIGKPNSLHCSHSVWILNIKQMGREEAHHIYELDDHSSFIVVYF